MTERQVLDLIVRELRVLGVPVPVGLDRETAATNPRAVTAWARVARRIVSEAEHDQRSAARAASIAGFAVTRGRTRL